jgi:pantothenate kinase
MELTQYLIQPHQVVEELADTLKELQPIMVALAVEVVVAQETLVRLVQETLAAIHL